MKRLLLLAFLCVPLCGCDWWDELSPTIGEKIGDKIDDLSDQFDDLLK